MKADDVRLLWRIASLEACGVESGYDPPEELLIRFARACEQHGIERAKAHAGPHVYPSGEFWRVLDAEVAKENEDG